MQLLTSPAVPLNSAVDTPSSVSQVHPGSLTAPVETAAPSANTPVDASPAALADSPIGPPTVSATIPIGVPPATTDNEPVFGLDAFITNAMPGTTLNAQGIFAVFSCTKEYGYDLVTETLEYSRVTRAPWDERDEFIKKRTILTETYETNSVTAKDLPGWALGLDTPAPSSTIEGGADIVAQPGDGEISTVTTPIRATSVESITTPGRDDGSSSDGFFFTKNASLEPTSSVANTSPVYSVSTPAVANPAAAATASAKSPAAATGLFGLMGPKPILDDSLDKTEKRHRLITHFFQDQIDVSNIAAKAIAATETSPVKSRTKKLTCTEDEGFSAFTPNTTRFFDDCELFYEATMALPSLTPLFEAAFPSAPCQGTVDTAVSTHATLPARVPTTPAAGPSTSVASKSTPYLRSAKKVVLPSGSIGASGRSVSSPRKRFVHEISDDDEVEIVDTTVSAKATTKGKGKPKVSASSKKQKKQKGI